MTASKYSKEVCEFFLEVDIKEFLEKDVQVKYEYNYVYRYLKNRIEGSCIRDACYLSGISEETAHTWKATHIEFSESDKKAESYFKKYHERKISSNKSWQSSAWFLERRYPEEYGMRQKLEHSGEIKTNSDIKDLVNELTRIREQIADNSENNS